MCDAQDGLWICLPFCSTCGLYGSSTWKLNIKPGLSQEGGDDVWVQPALQCSDLTVNSASSWSRAMCHLLVPLFLCSSRLRVCPELASRAVYRTADLLLLLNVVGTCLFSLPVVLVCGETETWNRDLQGLLSLLWKKWCLITSWCQRALQASTWTSSEDIPFNPACLFLPCSRESPRRGFGPAVLPTRLLSRLTYHR